MLSDDTVLRIRATSEGMAYAILAAHDAEVARKTLEDAALLALEWFPVEMLDGGGYWGARFANIVRARAASISTDKKEG